MQLAARPASRAGPEFPDIARKLGRVVLGALARAAGGVLVRVLPFAGLLPLRGRRLPRVAGRAHGSCKEAGRLVPLGRRAAEQGAVQVSNLVQETREYRRPIPRLPDGSQEPVLARA
eukprot:11167561-Lingulodinium_polyedra.AAC.1